VNGSPILDQQSIPAGYFVDLSPLAQRRTTGFSQEWKDENWTPGLRAEEDAATSCLGALAPYDQDLSHLVVRGMGITLTPISTEETSLRSQLMRAKNVLRRLPDSKKRAQELETFAKEAKWLTENGGKYAGRWIALQGDQLLAEGATAKEVFSKVEGQTTPPLVIRVVADDLPFAGW